mgnify:CR=1 FL=1
MMHKNTWRPDTCGCEIEYEWEDTLTVEQRVHTPTKATGCEHHLTGDHSAKYTQVLKENQTKNKVLGAILDGVSTAVDILLDENDKPIKKLKKGKKYLWSFDAQRNLVVSCDGFTPQEKASAQTACASLDADRTKHIPIIFQ